MARPLALALAATLALAAVAARPASAAAPASAPGRHRTSELPPVMLWAWEWPQDLRTLDPHRAGVAFLATTLALAGPDVLEHPRRQPLRLAPGTVLVAVARVEVPRGRRAVLDAAQAARAARAIAALAGRGGLAGVQVDFDAARSQRGFYRDLLGRVRAALPDSLALTMTALASWGLGERWLDRMPVDAAVPMTFRMGADAVRVRAALARGEDFAPPACRGNIGVALDEPALPPMRPRRVWVFRSGSWTPAAIARALARYGRKPS